MNRCTALTALAAFFVFAFGLEAQEAITIKIKDAGEGEAALIKRSENTTSKVKVTDGAGKVLVDQKELKGEVMEYKETILKREAGKPITKAQRDYTKAQKRDGEQTTELPLQGKSVLIEKKGEHYAFTYANGEPLDGPAAAVLKNDFSGVATGKELEKELLPGKAVKVGDTWKIDTAKIAQLLTKDGKMELDTAKAIGQGTLVKTYKKDGRLHGEMKFTMMLPLQTVGKGNQALKFADGAKIDLALSLDTCIDGTAVNGALNLKMLMTGTASIPAAPGATATMHVTVEASEAQQEAAKK